MNRIILAENFHKIEKRLYFIAIIPNEQVAVEVTAIKNDFAKAYNSRAALKSPPHITLIPPFHFNLEEEEDLKNQLISFSSSQKPFMLQLEKFDAFIPRVIYIHVNKSDSLLNLFTSINQHFEDKLGIISKRRKGRQFSPHMTVAFSDLTKENFFKAWKIYKHKDFKQHFDVTSISLLRHNGKMWDVLMNAKTG